MIPGDYNLFDENDQCICAADIYNVAGLRKDAGKVLNRILRRGKPAKFRIVHPDGRTTWIKIAEEKPRG